MPRASIPADRVAADARPAPGVGPTDGSVPLDDGPWRAFGELVGDLDWDAATAAGLTIEPDTTYQAVLDLTVDEWHELHRLLTAELQRPES